MIFPIFFFFFVLYCYVVFLMSYVLFLLIFGDQDLNSLYHILFLHGFIVLIRFSVLCYIPSGFSSQISVLVPCWFCIISCLLCFTFLNIPLQIRSCFSSCLLCPLPAHSLRFFFFRPLSLIISFYLQLF